MNKPRVLFICTGNSARSQMAEAFLRKYAGDRFEVYSAGLEPARGVHPLTIQVMEEQGFDMSGHRAKDVRDFLGRVHFGYVVTVCDRAERNCPIFPGVTQRAHWSFEDPAAFEGTDEARLAKFREVRDLVEQRVRAWLEEAGN
jgi:arsenate reductase